MSGAGGEFAGRLRERVVLQRPVDSPDGGGGVQRSWVDAATLAAAVEPLSGTERLEGGRRVQRPGWRITIRHRAWAEPARLLWRGAPLAVIGRTDDPAQPDRLVLIAVPEDMA